MLQPQDCERDRKDARLQIRLADAARGGDGLRPLPRAAVYAKFLECFKKVDEEGNGLLLGDVFKGVRERARDARVANGAASQASPPRCLTACGR